MKEGQKDIYYLLAPSLAAATASPHLEAFRKKGVEVLLLGEDVDNWMISNLREFDGRRLQSVAQGTTDLGPLEDQAETEAKEQASTVLSGLVSQLRAVLAGRAYDVRVTSRLTTSPACIVANEPENESSPAHRLRGSGLPIQPVLEINPQHPLVQRLKLRTCRSEAGRMGARPVRPGLAHPRGTYRGPGRLRSPAERPAGGPGGQTDGVPGDGLEDSQEPQDTQYEVTPANRPDLAG
jgi:HSP90 family molecular chaperone